MDSSNEHDPGLTPLADMYDRRPAPLEEYIDDLEKSFAQWEQGKAEGRSLGLTAQLDFLWRLIDGELTVIAARPGMGKTALALQIAENVAAPDSIPVIFSAEMSGRMLSARLCAKRSKANLHLIMNGKGKPEELARFKQAMQELKNSDIWIDDSSSPTTSSMLRKLDELKDIIPIRLMLFDFMTLAGDEGRGWSESKRVGRVTTSLKAIAETLEIPVIAISQLSRKPEDRADKRPTISDLRDSGEIEQAADRVVLIMRPKYYLDRGVSIDTHVTDEQTIVDVAKNRNGPTGQTKLEWVPTTMSFRRYIDTGAKTKAAFE